jgi:hypothetical protein
MSIFYVNEYEQGGQKWLGGTRYPSHNAAIAGSSYKHNWVRVVKCEASEQVAASNAVHPIFNNILNSIKGAA